MNCGQRCHRRHATLGQDDPESCQHLQACLSISNRQEHNHALLAPRTDSTRNVPEGRTCIIMGCIMGIMGRIGRGPIIIG